MKKPRVVKPVEFPPLPMNLYVLGEEDILMMLLKDLRVKRDKREAKILKAYCKEYLAKSELSECN